MPLFKRSFPGELSWLYKVTALVHLLHSSPPLHEGSTIHHHATGRGCPTYHYCIWAWGLTGPGPSSSPACPPRTLSLPVPPLLDIPFVGTPPVGCSFAEFLAIPTCKKWNHSSGSSLSNHHDKRTHVNSQEVKARSELSSAQGNENMPKLVTEAGPSFKQQQGQKPTSSTSSPIRATIHPDDGTVTGCLRSTGDWMWLTLILTQLPKTASQMKWPYKLPKRSTGRGYELPVGSAKAVSGLKLSWKWSAAVRLCGDLTMKAFKQRGITLLQNTAALWDVQDDGQDWPTAPPFHGHQFPNLHQRLWGQGLWPGKDSGIVTEAIPCPILLFLVKGND